LFLAFETEEKRGRTKADLGKESPSLSTIFAGPNKKPPEFVGGRTLTSCGRTEKGKNL